MMLHGTSNNPELSSGKISGRLEGLWVELGEWQGAGLGELLVWQPLASLERE